MPENPVHFDLTLAGGNTVTFAADSGATYSISDAGILTITTRHGVESYSPAGWWALKARPAPGGHEE